MKLFWRKLLALVLTLLGVCTGSLSARADDLQLSDRMSDSTPGMNSIHDIKMTVSSANLITNGSIKMVWSVAFNMNGILGTDVGVSGGDVVWGVPVIDSINRIVVIPFTGSLDATDGTLTVVVGGAHFIINPLTAGTHSMQFTTHLTTDGTGVEMDEETAYLAIVENVNIQANVPPTLLFTVSGVTAGQLVNGITTTVSSTSTLMNMGTYYGASTIVMAQDLAVSTNAGNGYTVTIQYDHPLRSGIHDINDFIGTNSVPIGWVAPPGGGTIEGYFGYTTDDVSLGTGIAGRFVPNNWSGLTANPQEIMYNNGPSDGLSVGSGLNRAGFQLQLTNFQATGLYTSKITYICTPVY